MAGGPLWWAFGKMLLLLAALFVLARYLPNLLRRTAVLPRRRYLEVLETLHLGTDRTIYLIKAGEARLVVGGSRAGLSVLVELVPEPENDENEV